MGVIKINNRLFAWLSRQPLYRLIVSLVILMVISVPSYAEKITLGKGSGVVWEGMPFSGSLSGPRGKDNTVLRNVSLVAITTAPSACSFDGAQNIKVNGYNGLKLAPGVILIPRLRVDGHFGRYSGVKATFGGTIGLPSSSVFMDNGDNMRRTFTDSPWCFSPVGNDTTQYPNYFSATEPVVLNYSGTWTIMADGTQTNVDNIALPAFYLGSYTGISTGNLAAQILPTTLTMRVSTLDCTIATTLNVDFGKLQRNSLAGAELARVSYPLTVSCSQPVDMVNANINVQFRAASGLHKSTPSWLAVKQGGAYITGELNNSLTGSGDCNKTTGLRFDSTPIKINSITDQETTKVTSNQVTWRLCSGGADLPVGTVDGSAEMLVTFN